MTQCRRCLSPFPKILTNIVMIILMRLEQRIICNLKTSQIIFVCHWVAYCGIKLISWLRIDDYCNVCCLFYFYLFGFSSHIFTRFLKGILEELSSCRFSSQSKINVFFFIFGLICHFCDGNRNIVSDILGRVRPKLICRLRYFPFNITHSANF